MNNTDRIPTTATIASGQSLSGAIDTLNAAITAIVMPATWTTAALTFQVSTDGTTYNDLYDTTGEASLPATTVVAASRTIMVDPAAFVGFRYVKVRSGTSGSAVAQGGDRTLGISMRVLA